MYVNSLLSTYMLLALRGPLVGRHLGRGYLGLPILIVTKTSVVPQQQRHRPREAAVPAY